jgi:hypothetical protein
VNALTWAKPLWYGMYLKGSKIGYGFHDSQKACFEKKPAIREVEKTWLLASALGESLATYGEVISWRNPEGKLLKMETLCTSSGRSQKIQITFSGRWVELAIHNGALTKRREELPKNAPIVTDLYRHLSICMRKNPLKDQCFYAFLPEVASFVKYTLKPPKTQKLSSNGKTYQVLCSELLGIEGVHKVFVSHKGDVLRVDAPMGLQFIPESEEKAKKAGFASKRADIVRDTLVQLTRPIKDPYRLSYLKLQVLEPEFTALPNDSCQTARREGDLWVLEMHPPKVDPAKAISIEQASKMQPEWIKPDLYIPSDKMLFRQTAAKLIKKDMNILAAALSQRAYVHKIMRYNASIGILRDATEILRSREGVCRDYAILLTTLLRASKIPARLVTGLVNANGKEYGAHVWVEIWSGSDWIGLDPTSPHPYVGANYIKVASGKVKDAFLARPLSMRTLEVLDFK